MEHEPRLPQINQPEESEPDSIALAKKWVERELGEVDREIVMTQEGETLQRLHNERARLLEQRSRIDNGDQDLINKLAQDYKTDEAIGIW